MIVFKLLYLILIFLLMSRMFMSFSNMGNTKFRVFVYRYTEPLLKPLRNILPRFPIDISPIILLSILNLLFTTLDQGLYLLLEGDIIGFLVVIIGIVIFLCRSLIFLSMLFLITRFVLSITQHKYSLLSNYLVSITDPIISNVRKIFRLKYWKYDTLFTSALLLVIYLSLGVLQDYLGGSF